MFIHVGIWRKGHEFERTRNSCTRVWKEEGEKGNDIIIL